MTESITDDEGLSAQERSDNRPQPGRLINTSELDTVLQDVNKDHPTFCGWNPELQDGCDPTTWHESVCADDIESINGHGYLDELFQSPEVMQKSHEEHGHPEPTVMYGYLSTAATFYLLRENRALRDEQAARHEEAMEVQRQILAELKRR